MAEFKELAVKSIEDGGSIAVAVQKPGWSDQTLRNRVKAAEEGKLKGAGCKIVTLAAMALFRLRAETA